jgi:hypothetical protein
MSFKGLGSHMEVDAKLGIFREKNEGKSLFLRGLERFRMCLNKGMASPSVI